VTHIKADRILQETAAVAKEHDVFGCDYVGLGHYAFDPEKAGSVENFVSSYTEAAKVLKANGNFDVKYTWVSKSSGNGKNVTPDKKGYTAKQAELYRNFNR
jgi:hypothetical protein